MVDFDGLQNTAGLLSSWKTGNLLYCYDFSLDKGGSSLIVQLFIFFLPITRIDHNLSFKTSY